MNDTLDELIEMYATLYGINEPVRMGTHINKMCDGWREEEVISAPEQRRNKLSISRDTQPKRVNNKSRKQESVVIMRSGQVSSKMERLML